MTELEIYQKVNNSETLEELADAIDSIADENGRIKGRYNDFDAKGMSFQCRNLRKVLRDSVLTDSDLREYIMFFNTLTRNYGIRQQAIYILTYS